MVRACLAISFGVALGACRDEPRVDRGPPQEEELRAPAVTVARLTHDPAPYDGQTVRVRGEVHDVLAPRVFALRDRGLLWAPKILVVARTAAVLDGAPLSRDERVVVIGIVHTRATEQRVRALGISSALAASIDDRPVLIARSIRRADD